MARNKKEDYKSYSGVGLGYSQAALDALRAGKYREYSGNRQEKYRTSQEQTQQAKSLPVLEGISIPSSSDAWESNFSKNKSHIDIDRARRNYAENYNQPRENQQYNDENYVVKRDRYNKLMQNGRLANDIKTLAEINYKNANQDATVSQEWADEYGAKAITGGLSKSQFLTQLSKRYELTPEELNDMALTFHSDANKQDVADYGKQLEKIGKNHELIGSAGSLVGTLGSGFEGMYNAGVGALTGDDRYLSNIFSTTKKAPREGVKQNIKTDFGKGAYDIGMGIADMAAGAAAGSAPVILAGNTANEAQESAMKRGSSVRRSSFYGGLAGVADYITNTIGLDKAKDLAVESIKKTGIKEFLKKSAVAGLGEAKENIYQDLAQSALDAIFNGENAELALSFKDKLDNGMSEGKALGEVVKEYIGQLGFSGALGFGMGSVMQAGKSTLPHLPGMIADKWAENKNSLGAVDPELQKYLADAMNQPEITQNNVNSITEAPSYIDELRNTLENSKPIDKAQALVDGGYFRDMVQAGEVFNDGKLDDAVQDYLFKMEQNGNPASSKQTVNTNKSNYDLQDKYGGDWEQMRRGIIKEYTGAPDQQVDAYKKELDKLVSWGGWKQADPAVLDDYVEHAPTYQGQISRGMHFEPGDGSYDNFMNQVHENGTITLGKPSSWTTDPETSRLYSHMGDNTYDSVEIVCNQNRTSTPINYINMQGEDEILSSSKASWTVLNEETYTLPNGSKKTVLYVAETGDKTPPKDAVVVPDQTEQPSAGETIPNGTEVPPSNGNPPLVTEPIASDETGQSRVITNTAINSDVISRFDYENDPIIKEMATYAKHNNEITYNNALDNVKKNGATLLDEYNSNRRIIDNDQDVDQAMILLRNLKEQIKNASPEEVDGLTVQKNMLLSKLRQAGTKWGEAIQAFAKWNETPEGALINSEKITTERTKAWEGQNQESVKANEELAGKLEEITNGRGYSEKKAKNPADATSPLLDRALRNQGYDGTMESAPKAPKTHEQHRVEVENSIRKELGSVADQFTDNDFEYLTSLVENKVPVETIIDEIEHRLNHGEWYTIDESTPVKKATSSKLAKILQGMGDDSRKAKNQKPDTGYPAKSHATITEEVVNTLEKEAAGLGLDTPTDIEFMTIMLEEGVPAWQIEDEINHRLMTGEWYSLDESIEEPKIKNNKLMSALNSLVEEPKPEKPELTLDEIKEQVRNTVDSEMASEGEFTDEDVNYLANLINNGATKEELAQALNTKMATGRFAVSPETQAYVNACFEYADKFDPNSREACEAKALAYKKLAEEVVGDASPFEKFEAWRYLAMLGNPKTMLRNLVGNTMFSTVTGVSNNFSAVLEAGVDKLSRKLGGNGIQRTKSVLNPTKDGGLIKGAWEDAESHRYKQLTGSKYEKGNMRDAIKGAKSVFSSKGMQAAENLVDAGISDYPAVRAKYSTSLAGWMKANGLDESAFGAEGQYERLRNLSQTRVLTDAERAEMKSLKETMDALEKGRDYAQKAAEYATFHEDNAVAKAFSKGSRYLLNSDHKSLRALGYGLEGIIPFKKTPANILRSGVEYSPLGAIDSIRKTGKLIYENTGKRKQNLADTYKKKSWWRGNESEVERTLASDVIDSWSKTLTGSGLAYLGYYLMSKGILNSSEEGEKYQDDLEGIQNYSITINGKTHTIDWAAPAVMPLLLGAEIKKIFDRHAIPDEKWYGSADEIVGSINALLDPIFETSMLQGIQNVMESVASEFRYNDDNSAALGGVLGSMATNALTGYATQALPTVLGQVARTVDPTRRTTDTATQSNFLRGVEKQGRKLMNKIPGLSFLNPAYRDAYGRTQNNGPFDNILGNFAYQTLSPAYIRDINTTDADTMARDVYNATALDENGVERPIQDKEVFAPWKGSVTYGGQRLTPEQMEVYRQASGEASYEIRDALAHEDWFKELSGQEQTDLLKSLRSLVNKVGLEANGFPQTGKDYEVYQEGGVPALLNKFKGSAQNAKIKEETGLAPTSNAAKEIKADMEAGNIEEAEQKIDEATQLANAGFTKPGPVETYYKAKGVVPSLTVDEYVKTYNAIDADGNQGIKQDELIAYFNNNHFTSEAEAMKYWNMYAPKGKKVPYLKKDGTWGKH